MEFLLKVRGKQANGPMGHAGAVMLVGLTLLVLWRRPRIVEARKVELQC